MAKDLIEVDLDLTLFIVMTALSCLWLLFILLFNSRIFGLLINFLVNRFDKNDDRHISIEHRKCRISVRLNGLELYIYNRSDVYDHLRDVKARRDHKTDARSSFTSSHPYNTTAQDALLDSEKAPNQDQLPVRSFWQDILVFPVVEVTVSRGTVVLGNELIPTIWRMHAQRATFHYTTYGTEQCRSPLDLYINTLEMNLQTVCIRMLKNNDFSHTQTDQADWKFWLHKTNGGKERNRDDKKYVHEMPIFEATEATVVYTWDAPGLVEDGHSLTEESTLPEQKLNISLKDSQTSTLIYGPFINKHRIILQDFFFPWDYEDRQELFLIPGSLRPYMGLDIQVDFGPKTVIKVPFEQRFRFADQGIESRANASIKLSFGSHSNLSYLMDWYVTEDGTVNTLKLNVKDLKITTSQLPETLWNARNVALNIQQPSPRVWNASRQWDIVVEGDGSYLYFLRAHQPFLAQLLGQWGDTEIIQTNFVPVKYNISLMLEDTHFMLCVSERNLMNQEHSIYENSYVDLNAAYFTGKICFDFTQLKPMISTQTHSFMATQVSMFLRLPQSNTVGYMRPENEENYDYWSMDSLGMNVTLSTPMISDPAMTSSMNVTLRSKGSRLEAHGLMLNSILRFVGNYFGEYKWHGDEKTYSSMRRQMMNIKPNFDDPYIQPQEEPRSVVHVDMVFSDALILLPATLYVSSGPGFLLHTQEFTFEVHNAGHYMDMDVNFNPIIMVPTDGYCPSHHTHRLGSLDAKESMHIDQISFHDHSMYGAPPFSNCYAQHYNLTIGAITGQVTHDNLLLLMKIANAIGFHFSDQENVINFNDSLFVDHSLSTIEPKVTTIDVSVAPIEVFLLGHGCIIQLHLAEGMQFNTTTLIDEAANMKVVAILNSILLRELLLVDSPNIRARLTRLNASPLTDEWLEVGHLVTSMSLVVNHSLPGWEADQQEQLRYLRYHDRESHRLDYILQTAKRTGSTLNGSSSEEDGEGLCDLEMRRVGSSWSKPSTNQPRQSSPDESRKSTRVCLSAMDSLRDKLGSLDKDKYPKKPDTEDQDTDGIAHWVPPRRLSSNSSLSLPPELDKEFSEIIVSSGSVKRLPRVPSLDSFHSAHSSSQDSSTPELFQDFDPSNDQRRLEYTNTMSQLGDPLYQENEIEGTLSAIIAADDEVERAMWEQWLDDGTEPANTPKPYLTYLPYFKLGQLQQPHTYLEMTRSITPMDHIFVTSDHKGLKEDTIASSLTKLKYMSRICKPQPDPPRLLDHHGCPVTTFVVNFSSGIDVFMTPMVLRVINVSDQSGLLKSMFIPQLLDSLQLRYMNNLASVNDTVHFLCNRVVFNCPALRLHLMQECGSYMDDVALSGYTRSSPSFRDNSPNTGKWKSTANESPPLNNNVDDQSNTTTSSPKKEDQSTNRMCVVSMVINDFSGLGSFVYRKEPVKRTNGLVVNSDDAALYSQSTTCEIVGTVSCKAISVQIRTEKLGENAFVQGIPAKRQQVRHAHEKLLQRFPTVLIDSLIDSVQGDAHLEAEKLGAAQVTIPRISVKCVELAVDVLAGINIAWEPYVNRAAALAATYRSQMALRVQGLVRNLGYVVATALASKGRLRRYPHTNGTNVDPVCSIDHFINWRKMNFKLQWDWNWRLIMHFRALWESLRKEERKALEAVIIDYALKGSVSPAAEFNNCVHDLEDWYNYQQAYNRKSSKDNTLAQPSFPSTRSSTSSMGGNRVVNRSDLLYFINMVFDQATDEFAFVLPLQQRHKVEKPKSNIQCVVSLLLPHARLTLLNLDETVSTRHPPDNWIELRQLAAQIDTRFQSKVTRMISGAGQPSSQSGQTDLEAKQTTTTVLDVVVIFRIESLSTHLTDEILHLIDWVTEITDQNNRRRKFLKERAKERAALANTKSQRILRVDPIFNPFNLPSPSKVVNVDGSPSSPVTGRRGSKGAGLTEIEMKKIYPPNLYGSMDQIPLPHDGLVSKESTFHQQSARTSRLFPVRAKFGGTQLGDARYTDAQKSHSRSAEHFTWHRAKSTTSHHGIKRSEGSQSRPISSTNTRWQNQLTPGGAQNIVHMTTVDSNEQEKKFYLNINAIVAADTLALTIHFSDLVLHLACRTLNMSYQYITAPPSERPQFVLPMACEVNEKEYYKDLLILSFKEFDTTVSVDLRGPISDKVTNTRDDWQASAQKCGLTPVLSFYCGAPSFTRNGIRQPDTGQFIRQCVLLHWDSFAVNLPQSITQIQVFVERFNQSGWLAEFFERRRNRQMTRFSFMPTKATTATTATTTLVEETEAKPTQDQTSSRAETLDKRRAQLVRRRAAVLKHRAALELQAQSAVPIAVTLDLQSVSLQANLMSSVHFSYTLYEGYILTGRGCLGQSHRVVVSSIGLSDPVLEARSQSPHFNEEFSIPFPEIAFRGRMQQGKLGVTAPYIITPHIVDVAVTIDRVTMTLTTDVINHCLFVHFALLKAIEGLATSLKAIKILAIDPEQEDSHKARQLDGAIHIPVLYCVIGRIKDISLTATCTNLFLTLSSKAAQVYTSNYKKAPNTILTTLELHETRGEDLFVDISVDLALTLHPCLTDHVNAYWGRFSIKTVAHATRTLKQGVRHIVVGVKVDKPLLIHKHHALDKAVKVKFEHFQTAVARATIQVRQELDIQKMVESAQLSLEMVFQLDISNLCVAIPFQECTVDKGSKDSGDVWPLPALIIHIAKLSASASNVNVAYGNLKRFSVQLSNSFHPDDPSTWTAHKEDHQSNVAIMPYAKFNWVIGITNPYRTESADLYNPHMRARSSDEPDINKTSSMVIAVAFDVGGLVLDINSSVGSYISMLQHSVQEMSDTLTTNMESMTAVDPLNNLQLPSLSPPPLPHDQPGTPPPSTQNVSVHMTLKIAQGTVTLCTPVAPTLDLSSPMYGDPLQQETPQTNVEDTVLFIPSFDVRGNYQINQTERSLLVMEKPSESLTMHVHIGSFSDGITFKPFLLQFIDRAVDQYRKTLDSCRQNSPRAIRINTTPSVPQPDSQDQGDIPLLPLIEDSMEGIKVGSIKVALFLKMEQSEFSLNCMPKSLINCTIKLPDISLVLSNVPGRYVTCNDPVDCASGFQSLTVSLSHCFMRVHHPYSAAESFKIDLSEIRMQLAEKKRHSSSDDQPTNQSPSTSSKCNMDAGPSSGKPERARVGCIMADIDQCSLYYNTRQLDELLQFIDMWFSRGYTNQPHNLVVASTAAHPSFFTPTVGTPLTPRTNHSSGSLSNTRLTTKQSTIGVSEDVDIRARSQTPSIAELHPRDRLAALSSSASNRDNNTDLALALEALGIEAGGSGLEAPDSLLADLEREMKEDLPSDYPDATSRSMDFPLHDNPNKSLESGFSSLDNRIQVVALVPKKPKASRRKRRVVATLRIKTLEAVANLGQAIGKITVESHAVLLGGHWDTHALEWSTYDMPPRYGTRLAVRSLMGASRVSSGDPSGQVLSGILNGDVEMKNFMVLGHTFRPASPPPTVPVGESIQLSYTCGLVALQNIEANIKYHANPVLVLETEHLVFRCHDMWTYRHTSPVPTLTLNVHLFCTYLYTLVSKETAPIFHIVAIKIEKIVSEQKTRPSAANRSASPDSFATYVEQQVSNAADKVQENARAAMAATMRYLVHGTVAIGGEEVLLVCFWNTFYDHEWALFFLRHYRIEYKQRADKTSTTRQCTLHLEGKSDSSLAVMKMENKLSQKALDWTAKDWTRHASVAPSSDYILQMGRCSVKIHSQHDYAANTIETRFVTHFPDSIGVSLDVSLYLFLKDTILLYIDENNRRSKRAKSEKEGAVQKSSAENQSLSTSRIDVGQSSSSKRTSLSTVSADGSSHSSWDGANSQRPIKPKYRCVEWLLKPELRLTSYSNIVPPDVEWVLEKLGFKDARHTIPKYMHQMLLESIDRMLVAVAKVGSEQQAA